MQMHSSPSSKIEAILAQRIDVAHDLDANGLFGRIATLERSVSRRNLLMAATGHDLKQPLQIILRAIEVLDADERTPRLEMWVSAAFAQIERISKGLTVLAMASLDHDDALGEPQISAFSVNALMDEIESDWCFAAFEKGLELRFVHCSDIIMSDREMLLTILGNLVGNAIKHSDGGRVLVGCRREGQSVRFEVIDEGPGIRDADQAAIFKPGFRGDGGREGMGLGLALVATLCGRLQHALSLRSRPGAGSNFAVRVPRCGFEQA